MIKLRFEGTSAPLFFCFVLLCFYFAVSPIFSCSIDFTERQIGHLYMSTFIHLSSFFLFQMQTKHQQPNKKSRHRVYTQRYDSTKEWLCILVAFWLAGLHTRAGMILPFYQFAMNSEMITLRYRQVKVRKMPKWKLEKWWIFSTFR